MRFSAVIVVLSAAFATTTSAALLGSRQSYASCALTCLTASPSSVTGCSPTDTACLCKNQTFVQTTTACFESSCSGSDLEQSLEAAQAMCRAVGVTLTSSTSGTPTSGSSSTKPSSTSSSSTNSADSNGVNALFALSALGLIGYAL